MKSHEVPEGWELKKITDIGEIISGSTPSTSVQKYWDGSIVWITPDDLSINDSIYLETSSRKITENGLKNSSARIIPHDSIVMSSRAPIGYLAIMKVDFATNQGCKSFKLKNDNPEFVYYLLSFNMPRIKQQGEGTTFSEISKSQLGKVKLSLPKSQKEQQKIASILLTIDKAIEKTKALIEKNKKAKQGLMQDVFTKGIDETGKPCTKFKKTKLGKIPVEWDVKELRYVGSFKNGINKDKESFGHGIKFVNIIDAYLDELNIEKLDLIDANFKEVHDYRLEPGDIIFVRSSVKPEGVGYNTLFNGFKEDVVFCGFMIRYRIFDKTNNSPSFYNYYFRYEEFRKRLLALSTISANTNINQESLKKLLCIIPIKQEQKRITDRISAIESNIHSEEKYLNKLIQIKTGLMQDLLTGKVRVKVAAA